MAWWIKKHKHSITNISIFRVISFSAFTARKFGMGFFRGSILVQGFLGVLYEALAIFLDFDFCTH